MQFSVAFVHAQSSLHPSFVFSIPPPFILGFVGDTCTKPDDCLSNPCKNGASCNNTLAGYECICTLRWEGRDWCVCVCIESVVRRELYIYLFKRDAAICAPLADTSTPQTHCVTSATAAGTRPL